MPNRTASHLTPSQAVHEFCHYCVQCRLDSEIENCTGYIVYATGKPCPLYPYRMGKRPPLKIIKLQCRECMGGSFQFVRECETIDCLVHPFRFGKNPAMQGTNREQMARIRHPDTLFSTVKNPKKRLSSHL